MKTNKFFKRALTLLLTLMMLLSTSSLGLSAAQVDVAETGATITSDGTARLYFNMSAVSWWVASSGNGNFAYFFNNSTGKNAWSAHSVNYSGNTYYVVIPAGDWAGVILTRNNTSTSPSWDNKWNQTGDITLSSTSNYISKFSEGSDSVTWGTAQKITSTAKVTPSDTTVAPGDAVTLTPALTSNTSINTIKSTTYSVGSGASVSGNTFTATQPGTYTVTATVTYHPNGYSSLTSTATATTTITVQANEYSYTASAGEGGSVSPTSGKVTAGQGVQLTATPNTGYTFDKWTFTNGTGTTTSATTTFTPSANGATAVASFKKNTYSVFVSASPAAGGTVTKNKSTVEHGGSVTFTASADTANNYVFTGWTINGVADSRKTETLTITNVVENLNVVANFDQIPTYTVNGAVGSGQGTVSPTKQIIAQGSAIGSAIDFTATPAAGYKFSHWVISGTYSGTVDLNSASIALTPTADNLTATAHFVKVWTVTFKDMDGKVLKTQTEVVDGTAAIAPDAPSVAHYTFKEWDTDFSNVKSDLTVTAVYTGKTYTVTLNTATGGTATTTASSVTYPNTVTLTATPATDYIFTGWDITGDYEEVSSTSNSITIKPEANVTVTPKFVIGQYLTVHSYSTSGYDMLYMWEKNEAGSVNYPNGEWAGTAQSTTTNFNGVDWKTSAQLELTNGFSSEVGVILNDGGMTIPSGSGNLIMFNNTLGWSNVYLYTSSTDGSLWSNNGNGATTSGRTAVTMTKISGTNYYYAYVSGTIGDTLFVKDKQDGYGNLWETSASYRSDYSSSNPMFTPSTTSNETRNNTAYYSSGSWGTASVTQQSDDIFLTDYLYKDGAWAGVSEIWITEDGKVTLRRALLDLVADTTTEYNGGTNSKDYTSESWTAFVNAYTTAKTVSGAATSTQTQIDEAYAALQTAYENLELQAYYTVNVTQNFAGSATVGTTSFKDLSKAVTVVQNKAVSLKFVAPTYYYIVSVKINGEDANLTATNAWTYTGEYTFTEDNITIEVVYEENPQLTVNENVEGGTVTLSGDIDTQNRISYGYDATLNITAPNLYYIQNVLVNGQPVYSGTDESKTTLTGYVIQDVVIDTTITITYAKRTTYTISIDAYPTTGGTLYYGDTAIPATGTTIEVLAGESVTITAKPNSGYAVYYWVADGKTGSRETTYTFSAISAKHTLDIEWVEVEQITVTTATAPGGVGTATVDGGSSTTVDQYTVVTLVATVTDTRFQFVNWTIEGSYYAADSSTRTDATFKISANSNIKATANFTQVYRRIYLKNDANWPTPYVYHFGGSQGDGYPGLKMTYDSATGYWYRDVPMDITGLKFNQGGDAGVQYDGVTSSQNLFTNNSDTTGYPTTYVEDGYYLQGNWNGKTYSAYDLQMFTPNGDGTYSLTITVTSTTDGYIYVNPTNEKSHYWNANTANATGNPQTLVATGAHQASPKYVKVKIDTSDYTKDYDITFTFNPTTGKFSWTTPVENVPTISIVGTDGRGKNQADETMNSSNDRVGDTYFDLDTVNRVNEHTYHAEAQVVAGSPVTFYTQVNDNGAGGYDYYVAGWVLNGTDFISATALGNGLYSGSYVFTADSDIVPVYFHTNDWLTSNNVSTVTVYAVADKTITNWDKYFAAYTWYKTGGTTVYEQFGAWSGQLMIPVAGLNGVYYTIVETSTGDNVQISGISFNNYPDGDTIDTVVTNYSNIQTYDYYEFISLLNDGKENITFVIKDTNTNYNAEDVAENTNETISDFQFVQYTDYSGLKTDIFGNNIESIDSTLSDSDALYIIQAGNKNVTDDTLDGQYYVECYLYTASGTYLGKCYSYELHDKDSAIWSILSDYENQRAYVSYETVNGARYDGEWYGDAKDVTVTINLAVNVALMTNGSYTVKADSPVNEADYGTGYINVSYQNVDATRGATVTITATPKTGYKFVGWYSADGTLFTTNTTYSVTAAIGTTYTAVFEALEKGYYYVNHYIYQGVGSSSYLPPAHGGNAVLYVGIDNTTQGTSAGFSVRESAYISATEGDVLLITIATDATGADKFYAWYTDAVDKYGLTTFEEVGVDSVDNIYNNNGTVVGRNDIVYFRFYYTVKDGDNYSMTLYSDLMPVSVNVTLVYQYTDRYENTKSYYVPYTLTTEEIEGFAGNGNTPYTPAYISGDGWVNTIIANAPYVEDYFKDTTWKINSAMYDTMTFLLWATQPYTMYTVTTTVITEAGSDVIVNQVPYNTVVDLDIRELVPDASYTGFWYNDVNNNSVYDKTVDIILTYGPYYGYRVTQDMAINYEKVDSAEDYEFNVSLDAPVYGREQTTDKDGNNETDIVIVDYVINILTPYFYYLHPEFTPIYDGKEITDEDWNKTLVTIESLEKAGYKVEFGILLEQVGTFKINDDYAGKYEDAEAAAIAKGYGTATDETLLKNFINSGSAKGWINGSGSTYGYKYDATGHNITNKNRVLFVFEHNNSESNWNRFYNVYSYLTVTTPEGVTTTYISNVQTMNIYEEGIKDAVVDNNTSFA